MVRSVKSLHAGISGLDWLLELQMIPVDEGHWVSDDVLEVETAFGAVEAARAATRGVVPPSPSPTCPQVLHPHHPFPIFSPVESWVVVEGNRLPVDEIHDSAVAGPWEWMGGTQYCGMRVVVG